MPEIPSNIVFVSGTDTGVGKTLSACLLLLLLRYAGLKVRAVKPVETGCVDGSAPQDAVLLQQAAGGRQSIEETALCTYALPAAPSAAARAEGGAVDVDSLVERICRLAGGCDLLVMEGAGGLLVPLAPRFTYADLLSRTGGAALVVAANRLGVLNHTSLTLEVLKSRGLPCLGYLLNNCCGEIEAEKNGQLSALHSNRKTLAEEALAYEAKELFFLPYLGRSPSIEMLEPIAASEPARRLAKTLIDYYRFPR